MGKKDLNPVLPLISCVTLGYSLLSPFSALSLELRVFLLCVLFRCKISVTGLVIRRSEPLSPSVLPVVLKQM